MRLHRIAVFGLATTLAAAASAAPFQGTITSRVMTVSSQRLVTMLGGGATEPQKVFAVPVERFTALADTADSGVTLQTTTISLSGSKGRLDGLGNDKNRFALIDVDKRLVQVVVPEKKAYLEWTPAAGSKATTPGKALALKPLGKSEKINGFKTSAYEVRDAGETVVVWVTTDDAELARVYRSVTDLQKQMRNDAPNLTEMAIALAAAIGLPVRVQTLDARQYSLREISAVSRKPVAADQFNIPAGFTRSSTAPSPNPPASAAKP